MTYRNSSSGRDNRTFNVYGYSLALDSSKTVASITLPGDRNVEVLAIDEVATVAAPTALTVSTTSSTAAKLSWTDASGTVTGYNVYRGTTAGGESTTPINSTPLSAGATTFTDSTALAGNTYFYVVKAINGPAASPASNEVSATMPTASTNIQVDLNSEYNLVGITADGSRFTGGGLDGHGNALSETEVGTSQTWGNVNFNIAPAGANNVIQAAGQTIGLPNSSYTQIEFLATGVNGGQANQTFTVRYTDGSSDTYVQSFSDWAIPQGFSGESDALSTAYRNTSSGSRNGGTFDVYGYSFAVNSSKTIESITLPNNKNVDILAMTVVGVSAAAPLVTASGNLSTFTFGSPAVPVDSNVTIASSDTNLTSAKVTISATTLQPGDTLNFNNQNGITGSYSGGILTLSGTASVANYQAALQSVTFSTTSTNTTPRALSIVTRDNLLVGNVAAETVNVAPVVIASGTTNTFTVGGSAVAVDSGVTVNSNDPQLMGATVTISAGTLQTGDTLNFTNQNGITGSYSGGVLTLNGAATVAQYVTALQSVTFSTVSTNTTTRTLSVAVEDNDSLESNEAPENVDVTL